jgi:hypothetical protein
MSLVRQFLQPQHGSAGPFAGKFFRRVHGNERAFVAKSAYAESAKASDMDKKQSRERERARGDEGNTPLRQMVAMMMKPAQAGTLGCRSFVRSFDRGYVIGARSWFCVKRKFSWSFLFCISIFFMYYLLLGTRDKKRTVSSSSHSLLTSFTSLSLSLLLLRFTLKTRKHADAVHG